jgi:hypothetical protein
MEHPCSTQAAAESIVIRVECLSNLATNVGVLLQPYATDQHRRDRLEQTESA